MPHGQVRWFDPQKGIGAIQPDSGGPPVTVERNAVDCEWALREGPRVEFDLCLDENGLWANNVDPKPDLQGL
ncbi:cold-shock protein [Streptomyces ficellus]|uniref:cold-shock protein n=1 Tax=Streptomyces ficellus TaxID=1977088 RepID=UPI0025B0BD03|nr:cold shock domain-containing protein [Streptomyces ficellus]